MTQEALAREIEAPLRTVQRWEEGQYGPSDSYLLRLSVVLDVTPASLYVEKPAA